MGMTVEFYSAIPREFVELFSVRNAGGDLEAFFQKLETYPVADFSFHLHLPEDLDSFCRILRKRSLPIPSLFADLFVEQLWSDGLSDVNFEISWEEFRSFRGRFGLFDVAIQCRAGPRNVQNSSHEVSKFTPKS